MKHLQLSLLTLLMLVTTIGVLIALFNAHHRNRELMVEMEQARSELHQVLAESARLKSEFGYLTIEDPTKIHAVAVPSKMTNQTWIYRIYLPDGHDYFIGCRVNNLRLDNQVPKFKIPSPRTIASAGKNTTAIGLTPGEYLVTARIFQKNDVYHYTIGCTPSDVSGRAGKGGGSGGSQIQGADGIWPAEENSFASSGVGTQLRVAEIDKPLVLLNGRGFGRTTSSSNDSPEGIMIWIGAAP